jgi:hypothetical protein
MFCYVPTAGIEIDFTTVDYGSVTLHYWSVPSGDRDMTTDCCPTVRGIGNTDVRLNILQNDMGFGVTGDVWNNKFRARLGDQNYDYVEYWPDQEKRLDQVLPRCNVEKLDFCIKVDKAMDGPGYYNGDMWITPEVDTLSACLDDPLCGGLDDNYDCNNGNCPAIHPTP